jgi:Peptidase family C25
MKVVFCIALFFAVTVQGNNLSQESLAAKSAGNAGIDCEWSVESFDAKGLWLYWKNPIPDKLDSKADYTTTIAIAPGTRAIARLIDQDGSNLNLSGEISVSPSGHFRDIAIAVVHWIPKASSINGKVCQTARFRIDFEVTARSNFRSTFAPAVDNPAELALANWIVNYTQSRNLRSTPSAALGKIAVEGPSFAASLPKDRLVIKTSGENIQFLDYAALVKSGLPLAKIDPQKMHLYHDGIEVPIYIQGEDDGKWNPGDYLEFIGKRAKGENSYHSFYSPTATFILTWDGGQRGLRAPLVPVASQTGGAIPLETQLGKLAKPHRVREHLELDLEVLRIGSTSVEEVVDLGSRVQAAELTDFWVWKRLGTDKDASELSFSIDYHPLSQVAGSGSSGPASGPAQQVGVVASDGALQIKINLKGITNNPKADPDHHLKFILNGSDISLVGGINHDAIWEGQESFTWTSPSINPSILKAGANTLVIQKVNDLKTVDGQLVENQDAYVNYIELDFPATYKTQNNNLRFSNSFSDSLGNKLFTITGFTSDAISLWDKQGRKLSNFKVTRSGGLFDISFMDSLVGPTAYLATISASRELPSVSYETLPDLINPSQGADYLIITQSNLLGTALDSLVKFRTKQGLRCAIVLTNHIYQAFGDGSMDPNAIRRFVAHAYKNWPRPAPLYLNLVGDATFWYEKRTGGNQVTTVPTHMVNIRGWGVAANDDFFAKVSGDDDIADLFVGRLPVSNREELGSIVHKTLLLETSRPDGHWRNKALLISGFESSFMEQNDVLQSITAGNDRQLSRVDLFPGSSQYKSASQRINFFEQMDSAFNIVSFVGHGGGAVWSDAGVLTLKALDEGKLKGEYPIPLVSSVTCLTGYFEDIAERSLGEELVRMTKGGAAGFYGASGYISNVAGQALSSEILKSATGNGLASIGAITTQAETMVKLRTGDAFLPILAEFNLLGDPALRISFPKKEGALSLNPQALAGNASLQANGSALALENAEAKATIYLGDSLENETLLKVEKGAFSFDQKLGAPITAIQNGKIVVNYWNEKDARVVSAPFSTLDWLIDSIAIQPANAAPGDSISIHLKLNTAYAKISYAGGIASYALGSGQAPLFPGENQITLETSDGIHLSSAGKILLQAPKAPLSLPRLYLAFRLNVQVLDKDDKPMKNIDNLTSRIYSVPLSDLASLELVAQGIHLPIQEKLGVWVLFHNKGLGSAKDFKVGLMQDAGNNPSMADTLVYGKVFPFGGLDSVFFPITDKSLDGQQLRAWLIGSRAGELAAENNSQDTIFHLRTKILASQVDTFYLDTLGTYLRLGATSPNHRLFCRNVSIASLPEHLAPSSGSLPVSAFLIESEIPGKSAFILEKTNLAGGLPKSNAQAQSTWHYSPKENQTWLKLDTLPGAGSPSGALGSYNGLYAPLINTDFSAPIIQISSRGQTLLPDDFVPLHTAIDITIRDGQGIDKLQHPPTLTSKKQAFNSANQVNQSQVLFPTLAHISFLPTHKADQDSLTIVAEDVSGNRVSRSLLYKLGEDLAIRDLGSYPNPFADTATFVFRLTDYCDKVDLKVYSRAGRLVCTLQRRNVVGYQEVVWDGLTTDKRSIANGLYFLKVTAVAGSKEASRTFKLFKKLRK